MDFRVKQSGTWKPTTPLLKVSGVWKNVQVGYVKVSGTWKAFYYRLASYVGLVLNDGYNSYKNWTSDGAGMYLADGSYVFFTRAEAYNADGEIRVFYPPFDPYYGHVLRATYAWNSLNGIWETVMMPHRWAVGANSPGTGVSKGTTTDGYETAGTGTNNAYFRPLGFAHAPFVPVGQTNTVYAVSKYRVWKLTYIVEYKLIASTTDSYPTGGSAPLPPYSDPTNTPLAGPLAKTPTVTLLAGAPTSTLGAAAAGTTNATGTSARFTNMKGVCLGHDGALYAVDQHAIRRISTTGVVTTVCGNITTSGSTNATGTSARFNDPRGIVYASDGNYYISDYGNNLIRKATTGWVVTTAAGTGTAGGTDGVGTSASVKPTDIAAMPGGDVYFLNGDRFRRYAVLGGEVTTVAGPTDTSSLTNFGFINGLTSVVRFGSGFGPLAINPADGRTIIGDSQNYAFRPVE